MPPPNFDSVAKWVLQHHDLGIPVAATETEISQSLATLYAAAGKCEACIMVPDLFPGSALEAIYIPKFGPTRVSPGVEPALLTANIVTPAALSAIGNALATHLQVSDNDMVHYQFDDGPQAVIYFPAERSTVLQALGLTLLEA